MRCELRFATEQSRVERSRSGDIARRHLHLHGHARGARSSGRRIIADGCIPISREIELFVRVTPDSVGGEPVYREACHLFACDVCPFVR